MMLMETLFIDSNYMEITLILWLLVFVTVKIYKKIDKFLFIP